MTNSDPGIMESAATQAELPQPVKVFVSVALTLMTLALLVEAICRYWLHLGPPYNSPLLHEHFPDYLTLWARFQHFHTLAFYTDTIDPPFMYPAPIAVCYWLLFKLSDRAPLFLSMVVLCFVIAAVLFGRSLRRHNLGREATIYLLSFALITSFPLWFELKQANMEVFSWILVALGIWAFLRDKGYSAAACFGVAGAMKILPFFYLGLFVAKKQYRPIFVALLSAIAVTVPSLWLVYPHIAESWRLTNLAVSKFRTVVTLRAYPQLAFDHSVFGLFKRIVFSHVSAPHLSRLLTLYSAIAAIVALIAFFVWIRRLPVINQILCLCVATLIVPPTSFDYTLLSLYLPWALLVLMAVRQQRQGEFSPGLASAMVCFAILFAPETEIIRHRLPIAGQIKALTLVALLIIALRYRFLDATKPSGVNV